MVVRVLVMGASGRLGAMVRRHWGGVPAIAPIWQFRGAAEGGNALSWSPLQGPAPTTLRSKVDVVLCLAGPVPGPSAQLELNTALAQAACAAANDLGARHVFLASSAAVYGIAGTPHGEDEEPAPLSDYGRAKRAMELAALRAGSMNVTCLRIGNVAGADALLGRLAAGGGMAETMIDRFPGGHGPLRSYIGPAALAHWLGVLCCRAMSDGAALPSILNLASPGVVDMAALATAADQPWAWREAPAEAIARVELDTQRLATLCPPGPQACTAPELVREWRRDLSMVHP